MESTLPLPPPPTIRKAMHELSLYLQSHHSDAPMVVSQALMMHIWQVDKIFLIAHSHDSVRKDLWNKVRLLAQRHALGEPLAYILGHKEFYGRNFSVNAATLIPRPESEDVLEAIMHVARKIPQYTLEQEILRFADVGSGSGCLACTFAAEIPYAQGFMLDISAEALTMAKHNAQDLELSPRLQALQGSLYALPFMPHSLDILISNPPYVSEAEFQSLEKNVQEFEPKTALVPVVPTICEQDPHGLAHLEALAKQAWQILRPGGACVVEHGCTQGEAVRELFRAHGAWASVETGTDLAGLDRFCLCKK